MFLVIGLLLLAGMFALLAYALMRAASQQPPTPGPRDDGEVK